MKSQIKIDFKSTDKGLQPIIAIKMQDSDDPRDGLLKAFFEQLGGKSSWLAVSFDHHMVSMNDATTYITVVPVAHNELEETIKIIEERLTPGTFNGNYTPLHKTDHPVE